MVWKCPTCGVTIGGAPVDVLAREHRPCPALPVHERIRRLAAQRDDAFKLLARWSGLPTYGCDDARDILRDTTKFLESE